MGDLEGWLARAGLAELAEPLRRHDIGLDLLGELTDADMRELGLTVGQRKRLIRAVAAHPPTAVPDPGDPTLAERRQVTVMFIDLVGSTELAASREVEDYHDILKAYQGAAAGAVARHHGTVAKYMGDGILAYFGYPRTEEHAGERALRAGLEVLAAVAALDPGRGERLAVRIGVATGMTVIGDLIGTGSAQERQVSGATPNLAARLQALAEPGTMLIAEETRTLVGGLFELEPLPAREIRGFAEPVTVYRVSGAREIDSRFRARSGRQRLAPLEAREAELSTLMELWHGAAAGRGAAALVTGAPGSGKSRLLAEVEEASADGDRQVLRIPCDPAFSGSALHPVLSFLRRGAGVRRSDPPAAAHKKLAAKLREGGQEDARDAALLAALLDIPAEGLYTPPAETPVVQRRELVRLVAAMLAAQGRHRPILLCVEDLHWADPTTLEFLAALAVRAPQLPLLMVMTSRPVEGPMLPDVALAVRLELGALPREALARVVTAACGGRELPKDVLDQVLARAAGIPLHAEEIARALIQSGRLAVRGNRLVPEGALDDLGVPATLHDSLVARLDLLPQARETAQTAAAIGQRFEPELVAAVAEAPEERVLGHLQALAEAEIIVREPGGEAPRYRFRHALLQEAAYDTLLRRRRGPLHRRIAELLAERAPAGSGPAPELMAHHLSRAGEHEAAIGHGQRACLAALARSANAEAIHHAQACLAWLRNLPEGEARAQRELGLLSLLTPALMALRGYSAEELEETTRRALELLDRLGDRPESYPNLFGLTIYHHVRSERAEARAMAQRMLRLAERLGHDDEQVIGLTQFGHCLWIDGDYPGAVAALERAIELYDPERHAGHAVQYGFDPLSYACAALSQIRWAQGDADAALAHARSGLEHTRRIGHANSIGLAMLFLLNAHQVRGEREIVASFGQEVLDYCDRMGVTTARGYAQMVHNWGTGDYSASAAPFDLHDAVGARLGMTYYRSLGAEAALEAGDTAAARAYLAPAMALVEAGEKFWEPAVLRLRARIEAAEGADAATVAASLDAAAAAARALGAPTFEALALADRAAGPDAPPEAAARLAALTADGGVQLPGTAAAQGVEKSAARAHQKVD